MIECLSRFNSKFQYCLNKFLVLFAVMFLLQGCLYINNTAPEEKEVAFSKFLRGTVYLELRACGSSAISLLKDPQQYLRPHFNVAGEYLPSLYIEANASAAGAIDWQLDALYFVSQRPQQCGAKLRGLDYLLESLDGRLQAQVSGLQVFVSKQDIY